MTDLFTRAKSVGLLHIRDWLPNGREDNGEWVALNPTREDKTAGSLRSTLRTGAWIDNATDDRGGDAIACMPSCIRASALRRPQARDMIILPEASNARQHGQSLRLMTPHISAMPIPCSPRRNHQRKAIIGKGGIPVNKKD